MDNDNQIKKRKLQSTTMEPAGDIFVLPFFGQGHLNPSMELCRNISTHNFNVTLIIPSHLSSSIPSTFPDESPFIHVAEIPFSDLPPETESGNEALRRAHPLDQQNKQMSEGIKSFLSTRSGIRPTCVVIDVMMSWSKGIFIELEIPVVSFFTSGATNTAMAYGRWKAKIGDLKPGETRELPGLPKEMPATYVDLLKGPRGRPQRPNRLSGDYPHPEGDAGENRFRPPQGSRGGGPLHGSRGGRGRGSRGGAGPPGADQKPR
ncbi:hypothetical protein L1987_72283 [Smallanthus sonchifolius]|uniref:Uncharacterized protein n=1 Tax=Smallanthus sonchifolius TaxID=185202 RepID=A0ACB9AV27_9ASTR|nr:hypothetical protein L1987_72283 [Smallanthus sonchifolius]